MTAKEDVHAQLGARVLLAVKLRNEVLFAEMLRRTVESLTRVWVRDENACHSAAMVVSELVENALKYADWSAARRRARLRLSIRARKVVISVWSPLSARSPNYERLLDALLEVRSRESALAAYLGRIEQLGGDPCDDRDRAVRLGLARIAVEARARLSAKLDGENNELRLRASFRL